MLQRLQLYNDLLRAEIVPQAGGSLARLDWVADGAAQPLLRGLDLDLGADDMSLPSQLACFPMLPWSNRMAPDGFLFDGRRHLPALTRAGEPCPIHGDAWQQPWRVARRDDRNVVLALNRHAARPFAYDARLHYRLEADALAVELAVRNLGVSALPFGIGLHPWMPDPRGARLQAGAAGVWQSGPDKLPLLRTALPPAWDFSAGAALPVDGVDHVFDGWDGVARIAWPARGLSLNIEADMGYFILYVPPGRDVFCFEPSDHPINAHNLLERPGLSVLAPGAALRRRCVFRGASL